MLLNTTGSSLVNNSSVALKNGADVIGSGTITNNVGGTITKPDSPGTVSDLTLGGLENDALVDDQTGDLTINAGNSAGTSTGTFTSSPDSILRLGGMTFGIGVSLQGPTSPGPGEVRIAGAQVDIPIGTTVVATGRTGLSGTLAGDGDVSIPSGTFTVSEGQMTGAGTTTVASGASMRVTQTGGNYGLTLQDTRSVVNNGTVSLEQSSDSGNLPSLLLNTTGSSLVDNGVLDLRNGADIVGSGVVRVPASGVVRSSTADMASGVSVPVELAGRLDPTAGTLRVENLAPAAAGSTSGVVTASGGALELVTVDVPAGSRISSEGTGVLFDNGSLSGDGAFVVSTGTLTAKQVSMSGAGTTTVASGASMRVTQTGGNYGLTLQDTRSVVNNGAVSLEQFSDSGNLPSLLLNTTGSSLVNNSSVALKNGADVIGSGTITNNVAGTITKPDSPSGTSGLGATTDNFGTLRSESGLLDVTGAFPAITGTTLNRGTYEMLAPGKIKLPADITNNKATILLDGATAQLQDTAPSGTVLNGLGNLTVNSGSLTVRNGKNQPVGALAQSGTVTIGAGATLSGPSFTQSAGTTSLTAADSKLTANGAANVNGGTLRGIGTVQTGVAGLSVNTTGRLEPGLSGPGTLSVTGKVTLGAGVHAWHRRERHQRGAGRQGRRHRRDDSRRQDRPGHRLHARRSATRPRSSRARPVPARSPREPAATCPVTSRGARRTAPPTWCCGRHVRPRPSTTSPSPRATQAPSR